MATAIVTDSTSDLPRELAEAKGIRVVPLNVHIGSETFLDGVTIQSDEFFRRLKAGPALPKTSQPSAGAFLEVYREAARSAQSILSVHISSKVSGTYNSAVQARAEAMSVPELRGVRIEVVDTFQASMGLGLVVDQLADAAQAGVSFEDLCARAKDLSTRSKFFGLLDTLEYLHKGGRIGRAQMYLGSLLSIKPILGLVDGVAHPIDRVRSRQKGIARIAEIGRKEAPLIALSVLYGEDKATAESLAAALQDLIPGRQAIMARFGPVLGTYVGPEAIGIALVKAGAA